MVCSHAVSPFLGLCLHMHVNTYDPCLLVQSGWRLHASVVQSKIDVHIWGLRYATQACANSQFVQNICNACQLKHQHTVKHLI